MAPMSTTWQAVLMTWIVVLQLYTGPVIHTLPLLSLTGLHWYRYTYLPSVIPDRLTLVQVYLPYPCYP